MARIDLCTHRHYTMSAKEHRSKAARLNRELRRAADRARTHGAAFVSPANLTEVQVRRLFAMSGNRVLW